MENSLKKLKDLIDLSFEETKVIFTKIMNGEASENEVHQFLTLLSNKGEVSSEIAAGVYVLRDKSIRVNVYDAIDTCATDGLCEMVCPVNINTGNNIKSLKLQNLSFLNKVVSSWSANHFSFLQFFARLGLRFGKSAELLFGSFIFEF